MFYVTALHPQEVLDNRGRGQRTAAPQVGLSWFTIWEPWLLGAMLLRGVECTWWFYRTDQRWFLKINAMLISVDLQVEEIHFPDLTFIGFNGESFVT